MTSVNPSLTPTPITRRLGRLDQLRGLAVLGILPVNILLFAAPFAALTNPRVWGSLDGANGFAWWVTRLLFEQKFLTLFCMIFGAGMVLHHERLGRTAQADAVHRRRMGVLFFLGMLHAYGLWYGDILAPYAVCGVLLWRVTDWPVAWLWRLAACCLAVPSLLSWLAWSGLPAWSPEAVLALEQAWQPSFAQMLVEASAYQGDWLSQMQDRVPRALFMQLQLFPVSSGWRMAGGICLGMLAMRLGLVGRARAAIDSPFRRGAWVLALLGTMLTAWGGLRLLGGELPPVTAALVGGQPLYWGSLGVAWAMLVLFPVAGLPGRLGRGLARTGRMALSNYLLQSLVCMALFYGSGLGWFGQLDRWQLLLLAGGIGAGQLVLSSIWLSRFERGPAEGLWRRLSYRS